MGVNDHFDKMWGTPPEGSPPQEVRVLIGNVLLLCQDEIPDMPAVIEALEKVRSTKYFEAQERAFYQSIGYEALAVCRGWDEPHLYKWSCDTLVSALKVMYPGETVETPEPD